MNTGATPANHKAWVYQIRAIRSIEIYDNPHCIKFGCLSELATNYDSLATDDDGSCIIQGCTDSTAYNYNDAANTDDGNCCYIG